MAGNSATPIEPLAVTVVPAAIRWAIGSDVSTVDGFDARPEFSTAVLHEQVQAAFARVMPAHFTAPFTSAVLCIMLWGLVDHGLLLGAATALNAVAVMGFIQVSIYRRRKPGPDQARYWFWNYTVGSAIYGAVWGGMSVMLFVPDSVIAQMVVVLMIGGMAAGALTTHVTLLPALHAYHLTSMVPVTAMLVVHGGRTSLTLAALIAVFGIALTIIGRAGGRTFLELVRVQLHNAELVEDLTVARNELAGVNRQLEQRVDERSAQLADARQLAEIGRIASGIAHEVSNPLTWILSNLQYLESVIGEAEFSSTTADEVRSALSDATNGATRIASIVHDLTSLARRDAASIGPVDIHTVITACLNVTRNELERRAEVRFERGDIPPVRGNPTRLSQVFLNLLLNAADAMTDGDESTNQLVIETSVSGDSIVISVSDTGNGIASSDLERVFDSFYTTKAAGNGAGLGLAICRSIVEASGGTIEAASSGDGATFTITLPADSVDYDDDLIDDDEKKRPDRNGPGALADSKAE